MGMNTGSRLVGLGLLLFVLWMLGEMLGDVVVLVASVGLVLAGVVTLTTGRGGIGDVPQRVNCPDCGAPNAADADECANCGARI